MSLPAWLAAVPLWHSWLQSLKAVVPLWPSLGLVPLWPYAPPYGPSPFLEIKAAALPRLSLTDSLVHTRNFAALQEAKRRSGSTHSHTRERAQSHTLTRQMERKTDSATDR
jgi:hypothetical protein